MLLEAGSPYAHIARDAYWGHQGLALAPPDASCALGCTKTGPEVGPRRRSKVVGHLPWVALSRARRFLPQQQVIRGRCDRLSAGLGQYIQNLQILPGDVNDTYHTNTYIHIHTHTYTYIHIQTYTSRVRGLTQGLIQGLARVFEQIQ